jgi:phage gp36-like protein
MPVSYCTPADIRNNVAGTDDGTGTCAQLDASILLAKIAQASSRVSSYTGEAYDPSEVPDLVKDLTVQLATYYATLTYRKGKDLGPQDPVYLSYLDAMATLKAIAAGQVQVTPSQPSGPPGTPPAPVRARVINRIPAVFSPADSATEIRAGRLRPSGPYEANWP